MSLRKYRILRREMRNARMAHDAFADIEELAYILEVDVSVLPAGEESLVARLEVEGEEWNVDRFERLLGERLNGDG